MGKAGAGKNVTSRDLGREVLYADCPLAMKPDGRNGR